MLNAEENGKTALRTSAFRLPRSALALFAAVATLVGAAASAADPELAPVLSGCEPDYPPYCVVTPDNQADGFSVELLRAALKAAGREVVFKTAPWAELKQDLADGRLQALPVVGRTPEREVVYDLTFPYMTMHGAIVVRDDNADIHSLQDLKGRQVAVMQGDNAEDFLRRANLGAVIVPLPSFETALRELSDGKHDAVVIQRLVALHLMQKAGLKNLMPVGPPLKEFMQSFCFAVRKGDAGLLAALNEGLAIVMADGTFRMLHAKWFSALEAVARKKSRIVVGGDSDYPPYEFLDRNGQPAGYNVDMTRAIARQMGLAVDIRLETWSRVRQGLESGDIDVVQGMFYSVERDRDFDFSPQHEIVQHAIVVRAGTPVPADMKALVGKTILVMAGDMMEDLARQHGHGKRLVPVPTQEDALRLLAAGEQDCALVAKVPALYWIAQNRWHNLRVSAQSVLSAESCYAVPHGREALLSEFSQGLAAIKATGEYRQIRAKWLSPYEAPGISTRKVLKYAAVAILPLLALLFGTLLWLRSLRRQVASRTGELLSERAFLDRIINAIADPVFVKDDARRFVLVNDALCAIVGRPREALIGKDGDDMFPPDQVDVFRRMDTGVLDTGEENLNEEALSNLSSGEVRTIVTRKSRHIAPDGKRFLVGVIRDMTERKRAAEALISSEERFRVVAENLTDVVYDWDLKERIAWYGDIDGITGHPPGGFPRTLGAWAAILHPEDKDRVMAALEAHVKGVAPYNVEYRVTKRNGELRWWSARGAVLRDARGEPYKMIGSITDITERIQAEAQLRVQVAAMEATAEAILIADRNEIVTWVNHAFTALTGYTAADIMGRPSSMLAPEQVPDAIYVDMQKVLCTGKVWRGELVSRRKDGSLYNEEITITPVFDQAGVVAHHIAIKKDITERKRMEGVLREQQKLASMGTLARGMAHEINNPIMGVMNYAQLVKDKAGGNAELAGFADEIVAESTRVATITHSLLSFTERPPAQPFAPATLEDLVGAVLPPAAEAARKKGIALSCDVSADLPPVSCRRSQLEQVVAALLANAMEAWGENDQAHEGSKKILISARAIKGSLVSGHSSLGKAHRPNDPSPMTNDAPKAQLTHDAERRTCAVRLTVEDNGAGIPATIRERVFDAFFTTKDRTQHSGLGLWISRSITQEHGGELTFESPSTALPPSPGSSGEASRAGAAGHGTRFHVDLPAE